MLYSLYYLVSFVLTSITTCRSKQKKWKKRS